MREERVERGLQSAKPKKSKSHARRKPNRQAMVATIVFSIIFFFMIGYYMYFILVTSPTIVNNSYNKRIDDYANSVIRGTIYSNTGEKLAYTETNDTESDFSDDERIYPYEKVFAHAIGMTEYYKSGLESMCNYDLLSTETSALQKIINDFAGETERGCDIYTTYDVDVQQAAYDSLGNNVGAVYAIDPDTGAVLAEVSKPSFNPGKISEEWDEISNNSKDAKLLNRATQGEYIPGSIFKIVTTLEYIREDEDYNNFEFDCDGEAYNIDCFDGKSHYNVNLEEAFAYSCNSTFATIGKSLNVLNYKNTAEDLLFNKELPIDKEYKVSSFKLDQDSTQFDITQTSIGQGKTTVTPAHMALIASAIANDGMLMKPYTVDYVENAYGEIVRTADVKEYKRLMTKKESKILKSYMGAVCDYGTGKTMANRDYEVYGKTGTAEIDKDNHVNSWFVGYAEKDGKKIAIAVVLENIDEGSGSATNCVKLIFDKFFQ